MLILSSKDVKYCFVSSQKKSQQTSPLAGVAYRGHLFAKVKSYQHNQLDKAIARCREFLDLEIPVLCLIVKESTGFSLWYQDGSLKLVQNNSVASDRDRPNHKQLKGNNNSAKTPSAAKKSLGNKETKADRKSLIPFFGSLKRS